MPSLKKAQKAGNYIQRFVRARRRQYAELVRAVNPVEGYGDGADVARAYRTAIWLKERASELFERADIPEAYASPLELRQALESFDQELLREGDRLRTDINAALDKGIHLETLGDVIVAVNECREAIAAALELMGTPPTPGGADTFLVLNMIARRFPQVLAQLHDRKASKPPLRMAFEDDVQYLFQALLAIHFDDIRPEEPGPTVGGGSSRADVFLEPQKTVVEFKMTRKGLNNLVLRKELADDFVLYGAKRDRRNLFVFVYDPGKRIKNPRGLEKDLSKPRLPIEQVQVLIQQG